MSILAGDLQKLYSISDIQYGYINSGIRAGLCVGPVDVRGVA